jgi:hypothetical protein
MGSLMNSIRLISAALIIGSLVLLAVLMGSVSADVPVGMFSRDLNTLCAEAGSNLPPYAGALSLLNLMIWASIASLAFLVAVLLPVRRQWLVIFGALVCVLAADDAMSLHEEVGPALGIPEQAFYLAYTIFAASLSLALLMRARINRRIDASAVAFFLGGLLLAISVLVDQAFIRQHLAEDGPKFLGTLVWLTVPLLSLPSALPDSHRSRA